MSILNIDVTKASDKEDDITYPILMEATNSDLIVLFFTATKGTVMQGAGRGGSMGVPGYPSNDWLSATTKNNWKPFRGTITFTQ